MSDFFQPRNDEGNGPMRLPMFPGQEARTQRMRQSGILGTRKFERGLVQIGLIIIVFEALGAYSILNARDPALYLIGGFFIVTGFVIMWTMAPLLGEHYNLKRVRKKPRQ